MLIEKFKEPELEYWIAFLVYLGIVVVAKLMIFNEFSCLQTFSLTINSGFCPSGMQETLFLFSGASIFATIPFALFYIVYGIFLKFSDYGNFSLKKYGAVAAVVLLLAIASFSTVIAIQKVSDKDSYKEGVRPGICQSAIEAKLAASSGPINIPESCFGENKPVIDALENADRDDRIKKNGSSYKIINE